MIRELKLEENEVLVSFDVKSLFTNVPVDEALEVIQAKLLDDETLVERTGIPSDHVTHLLELCLRSTYFVFHGTYYQQQEGAAMGSPVSPVVANIYMEMFEELALRTATTCPRIWKRYVDNTFCVMERIHVTLSWNTSTVYAQLLSLQWSWRLMTFGLPEYVPKKEV